MSGVVVPDEMRLLPPRQVRVTVEMYERDGTRRLQVMRYLVDDKASATVSNDTRVITTGPSEENGWRPTYRDEPTGRYDVTLELKNVLPVEDVR